MAAHPNFPSFGGNARTEHARRVPASMQIYDALRADIVTMQLRPGENLNRQQIAEKYRASQQPVRDAFLRLEAEGLIEIFPQSRTLVAAIDIHHARETQFLRLGLELEVCRSLAQQRQPELISETRRIFELQQVAFTQKDLGRFSQLDWEFHHSLCSAAGYPDLWIVVSARSGHIDRLRHLNLPDPGKLATTIECHRRILESVMAGDLKATEAAVREHLSGTLRAVDEIRERHPEFF